MTVEVFAPAKINLTLHVTGQRRDRLHKLDSIVVFADVGDCIRVQKAPSLSLSIAGKFAGDLSHNSGNLVLDAARLFPPGNGTHIVLEKNLPVASGIGGGSADAAATLTAMARLWAQSIPESEAVLGLGADVPVCLNAQSVRMQGIGENLTPMELPEMPILLVNPGVAVSTPLVFAGLQTRHNAPMGDISENGSELTEFVRWLGEQRNDLQDSARQIAPEIDVTLDMIEQQDGCMLSRMSGSGATCFGIFQNQDQAQKAAVEISQSQPKWWVRATRNLR